MAKRRSAAQKRAFSKMIAGLRRYKRSQGKGKRRAKARRTTSSIYRPARRVRRRRSVLSTARRIRFRNPIGTLVNPSWIPTLYGGDSSKRKSRKRKQRRKTRSSGMAKRKRRRSSKRRARRASPRRRVTRRSRGRRVARRRGRHGAPFAARVRRGTRVIYMNPRRSKRRRSRRRNPGFRGIIGRVFTPYASGFITAMACAVIDTKLSSYPAGKQLVKVGGAIAIAMFGRRHPVASAAAIGALAGSQGYVAGTRLLGGLVAHNPGQAVEGLGEMQQTYPELGALLSGGVGALLQGIGAPDNVDTVATDYATALNNMAGDDE